MVELAMVRRMMLRALMVAPAVIVAMYVWNGSLYALSAAVGLGMAIGNLWLSARIIGGVAERNPQLLMPAAMATFVFGLLVLTGIALVLRALDVVYFPVTGFALIGTHLLVVLWEAAGAYDKVPAGSTSSKTTV